MRAVELISAYRTRTDLKKGDKIEKVAVAAKHYRKINSPASPMTSGHFTICPPSTFCQIPIKNGQAGWCARMK